MAGFECSSHQRPDGLRLDLIAATAHDRWAVQDYQQVRRHGMRCARDGVRWHLVERRAGVYCWDSWLPMLRGARACGVQVLWDLCHYGWPDGLDIWSAEFVDRFARYARAAAQLLRDESDEIPYFCPINEISYWAWAGAEVGRMNPGCLQRGAALKRQLVRAFLAAVQAIRAVHPRARILVAEPLIHVEAGNTDDATRRAAAGYRETQFETHDLLAGRLEPELGGCHAHVDLLGANFYPDNQWYLGGSTIPLGHHAYRPLRSMLEELHVRYGKPVLISETGAEGAARPYWLHHVCAEVMHAVRCGVPVAGVCLYPILDYPGWEDGRTCRAGLLSMATADGRRQADADFAEELDRQAAALAGQPAVRLQRVAES